MSSILPVGGQAVIEGVMMKSPHYIATSVRKEDGTIVSIDQKLRERGRISKLPFIRGIYNLVEMLIIGIKSLLWAGNQLTDESEEFTWKEITLMLIFTFTFGILFFSALPYGLTFLIGGVEETSPVVFNLIDYAIKIALFLGYVFAIAQLQDVKRIFQYHGAEHMAVHCYEHRKSLTVENVKGFTTIHPRCGSSFIMLVFVISVVLFSLLPLLVLAINPQFMDLGFWTRRSILFPLRLSLIPVIAGLAYEILKISDKYQSNMFMKIIATPGLWLQKITTTKPDNSMIEVAIASLKRVLILEKK